MHQKQEIGELASPWKGGVEGGAAQVWPFWLQRGAQDSPLRDLCPARAAHVDLERPGRDLIQLGEDAGTLEPQWLSPASPSGLAARGAHAPGDSGDSATLPPSCTMARHHDAASTAK